MPRKIKHKSMKYINLKSTFRQTHTIHICAYTKFLSHKDFYGGVVKGEVLFLKVSVF